MKEKLKFQSPRECNKNEKLSRFCSVLLLIGEILNFFSFPRTCTIVQNIYVYNYLC